jgi:transposase
LPDSIVYSDTFSACNVLDVSSFKHFRINHSELFSDQKNHINGHRELLEPGQASHARFNGIPAAHFHLYLKECEWRFNIPQPKPQQTQLIQWVDKYMR